MITLNPRQQQAVATINQHVLVLAGAGSGKTRVIIAKIINLINNHNVHPSQIFAVTFTNRAANEMRQRILQSLNSTAINNHFVQIKTFHSYGAFLLRRFIRHHPKYKHIAQDKFFTIADDKDSKIILKVVLHNLDFSLEENSKKDLLKCISSCKNHLLYPALLADESEDELKRHIETFACKANDVECDVLEVYRSYQNYLYENCLVDLDDLLALPVLLMRTGAAPIIEFVKQSCRYVLVDEYQDTNNVQESLIELMERAGAIITAVGDDSQSIYSFRGACIENIFQFEKKYANTQIIKLEENYRSHSAILEVANDVIKHNNNVYEKNLFTQQSAGDLPELYFFNYETEEADWITTKANELIQAGVCTAKDIAIFFRTNYQSKAIEDSLTAKQMPYKIVAGFKFYERKEIKDVIAYINFFLNGRDNFSLARVLNFPSRGIGNKSQQIIFNHLKKHRQNNEELNEEFNFAQWLEFLRSDELNQQLNAKAKQGLSFFVTLSAKFYSATNTMRPSQFVSELLTDSGLLDYYENLSDTWQRDSKIGNLMSLVDSVINYQKKQPEHKIGDFIMALSLQNSLLETDNNASSSQEQIQLMTIHNAKGLEFEAVFVSGMAQGLLPHYLCLHNDEAIEEERRLFYVAITRCKRYLYFSGSIVKMVAGELKQYVPSCFLTEIADNHIEAKNIEAKNVSSWHLSSDSMHVKNNESNIDSSYHDYF